MTCLCRLHRTMTRMTNAGAALKWVFNVRAGRLINTALKRKTFCSFFELDLTRYAFKLLPSDGFLSQRGTMCGQQDLPQLWKVPPPVRFLVDGGVSGKLSGLDRLQLNSVSACLRFCSTPQSQAVCFLHWLAAHYIQNCIHIMPLLLKCFLCCKWQHLQAVYLPVCKPHYSFVELMTKFTSAINKLTAAEWFPTSNLHK